MFAELENLSDLGSEMARRARSAGALLIWRAQTRTVRRVVVRKGRSEGAWVTSSSGHGVQVATPTGYSALGSRDDFRPEPALKLLRECLDVAAQGARLGLSTDRPPDLKRVVDRRLPVGSEPFDRVDLTRVARRLVELEAEILGRVPGVQLQLSFRAELEAWRIFRDDGTDVLFAIPRCALGIRATREGAGGRHGVSSVVFSTQPDLPWNDERNRLFLARAERSARLALELPDAPTHPPGSFPLVIDYALAKGLAHEAFGHASEADGYRSSVLARDGRFRTGDVVGADHVSIIDEPIEGDHAWQPYSANAVPRDRVVLVDHGRLAEGLSDIWSAGPGGVRLTGAARAESFRCAPQPRMTNIRIEVDAPLPAPGAFVDYGPSEVRDLLQGAGVFKRHSEVVFLSGYRGGQVNPTTGDFVFNCQAIYVLGRKAVTFHRPAIFSGSMFGALNAIREALGPLQLDAQGYCGKWGQSVPSSGGSHYFLVLDPDPQVRLGGHYVQLEPILAALARARPEGVRVEAWSLFVRDGRRLSLGIKDREIGNAHAPLNFSESCNASYRLVWEDGRVSRGHLERKQLEHDPLEALNLARTAAYDDPDAAWVLGPARIPEVPVHDPATAKLVGGETALLVRRLEAVRRRVARHDIRTWSGSFSAATGTARLLTSAGLDAESESTSFGWHVSLDGEIGDGFEARRPEAHEEFEDRLDRLIDTASLLQREAAPPAAGVLPVILHPGVVERYVLETLLANLDGSAVAHGDGHFRHEQFGSREPILREDISLRIDPLQPFKSGSYRFTAEGVPAAPFTFIENGRLVQPVLDLKYARRLGREPTPLPSSMDCLQFEGPRPLSLEQALAQAEGGALVLSVLGLNTQDSASGDFSLLAPQMLHIGTAKLDGRLRATISGNLFRLLAGSDLAFVTFKGEHTPGLLIHCRLDPQS